MSFRTYRALLIAAALMAGFLLALPVWDWWTYRQVRAESAPLDDQASAGAEAPASEAPPSAATAVLPATGGVIVAAAMAAPQVQPPARSSRVEAAVPPAPAPSLSRIETKNPATIVAAPSEGAVRGRPPAVQGGSPSVETPAVTGPVAGAVRPPTTTGPLSWVRSLFTQTPPPAPTSEGRPQPAESPTPEPEQESSDSTSDPDVSQEAGPPRLSLVPSPSTVAYGRVMSVRVVLSGGEGITSVPFHVRFDPALLEFLGAHTGAAFQSSSLEPLLLASVNPERPGDLAVGLALVGNSRSFTGSGSLVVLDFRVIGRGRTDLTFENSSVRGVTSEPLPAEFANATIQVD